MKEHRKRLSRGEEQNIIKNESVKKLVTYFCEQIKYDEEYRKMKIWF